MKLALGLAEGGTIFTLISRIAGAASCLEVAMPSRVGRAVVRAGNLLAELALVGRGTMTSLVTTLTLVLARSGTYLLLAAHPAPGFGTLTTTLVNTRAMLEHTLDATAATAAFIGTHVLVTCGTTESKVAHTPEV